MDLDIRGSDCYSREQAGLVEVVDVQEWQAAPYISSVRWPSTVSLSSQSDEIFVSDREDGTVKVLSANL